MEGDKKRENVQFGDCVYYMYKRIGRPPATIRLSESGISSQKHVVKARQWSCLVVVQIPR